MPSIRIAMEASLKRSLIETIRSRNIITEASDVKNTFSSWDNCMAKTYCKWPVIALIIVAGLIVLSVISCIVRCACCGLSCCCSCFSCLKCCGNCCGMCDNPRGKRHKYLDDHHNLAFAPQTGYKPSMPMMTGAGGPPQYAQFETGANGLAVEPKKMLNEDALPPMPSWETAQKKRITQNEGEAVEMGDLDPKTGQNIPLMTGAAAISRSDSPGHSPPRPQYGDRPNMNQNTSYRGAERAAVLPGAMASSIGPTRGGASNAYENGTEIDRYNRNDYGSGQSRNDYPPLSSYEYDHQSEHQLPYHGPNNDFMPPPAGTYPPNAGPRRRLTDFNATSSVSPREYGDIDYSDTPNSHYNNNKNLNQSYDRSVVSRTDHNISRRPLPRSDNHPGSNGSDRSPGIPEPGYNVRDDHTQLMSRVAPQNADYMASLTSASGPQNHRTVSPTYRGYDYPGYR